MGCGEGGRRVEWGGAMRENESKVKKRGVWGWLGHGLALVLVWAGRGLVWLLILLILVLAYLHLVGVPAVWLDSLWEEAAKEGYFVGVDKVKLRIDRGLVAQGVRLYAREDDPLALVTAEDVAVTVRPLDLMIRRRLVPVLEMRGGAAQVPIGGAEGGRQAFVNVSDVLLRLTFQEGEVVVQALEGRTEGIRFAARGAVYLGAEEDEEDDEPLERPVEMALQLLESLPEAAVEAVETWQSIRFAAPPLVSGTFTIYPDHPEANAWAVALQGGAGRLETLEWESLAAGARWREGRLALERMRLGMGDGGDGEEEQLEGSGWLDSTSGEAYAKVTSSLRPSTVARVLPSEWVSLATNWVDTLDFPLSASAEVGPGPLEGLATQVVARVSMAGGVSARGLSVDGADAEVRLEEGALVVPKAHVSLSEAGIAGDADFSELRLDFSPFRLQMRMDGRLVPTWADRFIPEDLDALHNLLGRFVFRVPSTMRLRIEADDTGTVVVRGPCEATDFDLHGVAVDKASALLGFSNNVVRLRRSLVEKGDTVARGDVEIDLDRQTVRFAAESTLQLAESGGLLGPEVKELLDMFRFEGRTTVRAEGTLDVCSFALNDITAHLDADRAGMGPWLADWIAGDIRVKGYGVEVSNLEADIYGGHVRGGMRFYPVLSDSNWRYEMALDGEDVEFGQFLDATFEMGTNSVRGRLTGGGTLSGYIGDRWAETMAGKGKAKLKDGWLFQVPVFNGLTSVLQLVLPDFSFFAQTDASAKYDIRDGRVWVDDATIEGSLFSVAGKGSYGLDNTLDFDVEVQLLRGGFFARLVRLVTLPVTHMLKFTVTGPLEDAQWRPTNLNPMKLVKLAANGVSSLAGVVGLGDEEQGEAEKAEGKPSRPPKALPMPKAAAGVAAPAAEAGEPAAAK